MQEAFGHGATLSGCGTVPKGILHYTDLVNKRVVNLEDTLFRGLVDTTLIRRQGLGRGLQNRFIDSLIVGSLRLQMGSEVWLRSTEANIQLAGSVVFSKVGDSYRADGVLTTPRGIYQLPLGVQFATRQFTVTRGEIRMLGTPDLNALVDIDAYYLIRRRTGDNMTVYIHIGGTLYVPTITLSSDVRPALPEAEIVSYLMFGGPLIAGTATSQGRQAAVQSFVSALSGQVESALVSNIGLPFDFFQISPPEQGLSGTQVELGWQWDIFGVPAFVTPTSRFGCQQSFIKTENWGLSLELRLSKDWRVAGSIEPVRGCSTTSITPGAGTRQAGVDVLWERNY
ncbi:MAG: translocation/assembly module TamB domain-containing protein, partial [Gemmatimonadetes bacterium]|nr:translocation/assembly module TamB domain-containing protein [Gemmatimonadota bacterium]